MDAATIIRDFTAKGVQLAPTDHGTISITPRSRLTNADRDLLRKHKADVLAELQKMNLMNLMNIDSSYLPPARIVRDVEPMFTPLASDACPDAYARLERLAIQSEDDVPPDRGWADVAGFADMPDLSPAEHGAAIRRRLMNAPAESMDTTTAPDTMPPAPAMAPQRVFCGQCCRFQPGPQTLSIGRCLATTNGQPPKDQRGYLAAFPMAPRQCPEFSGVGS